MSAPIRDVLDPTYCTSDPDTVAGGRRVLDFPPCFGGDYHRVTLTPYVRRDGDRLDARCQVDRQEIVDGHAVQCRDLSTTPPLARCVSVDDAHQRVLDVLTAPWEHLLSL